MQEKNKNFSLTHEEFKKISGARKSKSCMNAKKFQDFLSGKMSGKDKNFYDKNKS